MEERYIYFCNVTNARFCNSVGCGGNYEDFVAMLLHEVPIHIHLSTGSQRGGEGEAAV